MKIIASDYDGTLNHGGIDDKKREAIKKWRKAGNLFAIVSGRGPHDMAVIKKELKTDTDYFLADNGAVIIDSQDNHVCEVRCDGSYATPLIKLIFDCGGMFARVHTDAHFEVVADEKECTDNGIYIMENMPYVSSFTQISTQLPDFESAAKVTDVIKQNFGDVLNPLQNGECIDIVKKDIDKAKGIYMLLDIAGAEYEDVIAVGDNVNDKAMIEEFRSYAMENGVDCIKELADSTVASITELIEKELC